LEAPREKLKVLWWANAPYCPTGYGVGTKGVVYRIKDKYDVRLLCFYGLQGRALIFDDLLHYPQLFTPLGDFEARLICENWKPHVMVTFFDIWIAEVAEKNARREFFTDIHKRWIPWAPVDHDPSPVGITRQAQKAFHVVTMSKFGQEALAKQGVESTLIPLGVDTSIFKPTENKAEDVEWLIKQSTPMLKNRGVPWSVDDFIIGINAAPKDPVRKNFTGMFNAVKYFLEQNPDARKDVRVYLQSWREFPGGWPLSFLAEERGIHDICRVTHPYNMYCGFNEDSMSRMTRSWDVFFNLARREGFGIPIIEACACGVPPIVTDFTSMPELTEGHGWTVGYNHLELTNLLSYGAAADEFEAAEAIAEAYNNPDEVKRLGRKAREFSFDYDWDVVAALWGHLLDKVAEDAVWKPLNERWIKE